jgi:mannose-6-phosphate isomerase
MRRLPSILSLQPEYRDYVWGGYRLNPQKRIAEAWVIHEGNRIQTEPFSGRTLAEIADRFGPDLMGEELFRRNAARFPLLLKLLDCRQWLSLQVHPNDEQALRLEGPGAVGKTEAWHLLEADPGAELIAGMKPGVTRRNLSDSVGKREILEYAQRLPVARGETVLIRAGTLHALGPGLMVYEIQQSSDVTYRVYDWDRPPAENRKLHIRQALEVIEPSITVQPVPCPLIHEEGRKVLCQSEYFRLEMVHLRSSSFESDTEGKSFHLVTLIGGEGEIRSEESGRPIGLNETVLLPASAGAYSLHAASGARLLVASASTAAS